MVPVVLPSSPSWSSLQEALLQSVEADEALLALRSAAFATLDAHTQVSSQNDTEQQQGGQEKQAVITEGGRGDGVVWAMPQADRPPPLCLPGGGWLHA